MKRIFIAIIYLYCISFPVASATTGGELLINGIYRDQNLDYIYTSFFSNDGSGCNMGLNRINIAQNTQENLLSLCEFEEQIQSKDSQIELDTISEMFQTQVESLLSDTISLRPLWIVDMSIDVRIDANNDFIIFDERFSQDQIRWELVFTHAGLVLDKISVNTCLPRSTDQNIMVHFYDIPELETVAVVVGAENLFCHEGGYINENVFFLTPSDLYKRVFTEYTGDLPNDRDILPLEYSQSITLTDISSILYDSAEYFLEEGDYLRAAHYFYSSYKSSTDAFFSQESLFRYIQAIQTLSHRENSVYSKVSIINAMKDLLSYEPTRKEYITRLQTDDSFRNLRISGDLDRVFCKFDNQYCLEDKEVVINDEDFIQMINDLDNLHMSRESSYPIRSFLEGVSNLFTFICNALQRIIAF